MFLHNCRIFFTLVQEKDAEEAEIPVPEVTLAVYQNPNQVLHFRLYQCLRMMVHAHWCWTLEAGAQAVTDTKKTTFKSKPKLSESSFKEMPYTFLEPNDPTLIPCIDQLNLTASFPSSNVLVRNPEGDTVRSFYLTNDLVKAVVLNTGYTRMRLMTSGTKVVTKQEAGRGLEAYFRVLGEGLLVVLPYIDQSVILDAEFATVKTLLMTYYPLCTSFSDPFRSTCSRYVAGPGNHIVRFPAGRSNDSTALSLRLFGEDITTAARDGGKKLKHTSYHDIFPDEGADNKDEDVFLEGDNGAE
ncbi:hypothetical protein F4604DRAFT_1934623 [Suillus subluteus]|nr:hypothetical protein F4604DRAFT_1934623 [Suillus subluteus]